METTTAITNVKRDVQLQEWTEQIKAQQESGMTGSFPRRYLHAFGLAQTER